MAHAFLSTLGIHGPQEGAYNGRWLATTSGETIDVHTPSDGSVIGTVRLASKADYELVAAEAVEAFKAWRLVPAPQRGEVIRRLGDAFREHKAELGALISLEMGKIRAEGEGEVQECIDICDFAVGLSRQLYGLTMHSERPGHRMYEQYHPFGVVGIITAFNFPMAVWAWNAALAAICGDTMIWKPSLKTPLCAIAMQKIVDRVFNEAGHPGVMSMVIGTDADVGETMIRDKRLPLISATGSCRMGRHVGTVVAQRLGRSLLELGGNNAIIVEESADLELAMRAIVFGAVGTAGQRCTSTRRVIAHRSIARELLDRVAAAYRTVVIGDPLAEGTLMGPLIDEDAIGTYRAAIEKAVEQGGEIVCGPDRQEGLLRRADDHLVGAAAADLPPRDLRAHPLHHALRRVRGRGRGAERRRAGPELGRVHEQPAARRGVPGPRGQRLRHREREHRHQRGRDRRGLRRGEGHRRRARVGLGRVEGVHAPTDLHDQLLDGAPLGAGDQLRVGLGNSGPL